MRRTYNIGCKNDDAYFINGFISEVAEKRPVVQCFSVFTHNAVPSVINSTVPARDVM